MAPNTRDTPLRRTSTYIWGVALMLGACIVAIMLSPLFMGEPTELEDDYQVHEQFNAQVKEIHEKQAEIKASYHYDREKAAQDLFKQIQSK